MALALANTSPIKEYVYETFTAIQAPVMKFKGILKSGGPVTVTIVDEALAVVGTFVLDTIGVVVDSGFLTNLPYRLKWVITSGSGQFTIEGSVSV